MLTRTQLLTLGLGAIAINAAACVLTTTTDGVGGFGGNGTTSSATTGSTSSSTSSTTTTTSSTTTSSSTGGGCTNPTGTGKQEAICDQMAAFPATCSASQLTPLAVAVCHKGFSLYTAGSWEELQGCFDMIPATTDDTCVDPAMTNNVKACLSTMYADACANSSADTACDNINASCNQGVAFDVAHCKSDLLPFSAAGVNLYIDCINNHPNDSCDTLHATCFDAVTTIN